MGKTAMMEVGKLRSTECLSSVLPRSARKAVFSAMTSTLGPERTSLQSWEPPVELRSANICVEPMPTGAPPVAPSSVSWYAPDPRRSEEHTSELQSHLNLVFRLLLE